MLAVCRNNKLYVPLFMMKANGMWDRFTLEDCIIGNTFHFPLHGDVEKWQEFCSTIDEFRKERGEDKGIEPTIPYWTENRKNLMKQNGVSHFDVITLTKARVIAVHFNPHLLDNGGLSQRFWNTMPNMLYFRSTSLQYEHRFIAAMSVLDNIPKAIDIALRSMGSLGYKGNYAVIDLKKWFDTRELSYTLS